MCNYGLAIPSQLDHVNTHQASLTSQLDERFNFQTLILQPLFYEAGVIV